MDVLITFIRIVAQWLTPGFTGVRLIAVRKDGSTEPVPVPTFCERLLMSIRGGTISIPGGEGGRIPAGPVQRDHSAGRCPESFPLDEPIR